MSLMLKHQSLVAVFFLSCIVAYSVGMWCCSSSTPKPDAKSLAEAKADWVSVGKEQKISYQIIIKINNCILL